MVDEGEMASFVGVLLTYQSLLWMCLPVACTLIKMERSEENVLHDD